MATAPTFATTIRVGAATVPATLDTSFTAPTNVSTVLTAAGASGSKIDEVRITQLATTSGTVILNLFIYDGSSVYSLLESLVMQTATVSTTTAPVPVVRYFQNLSIPTGHSLRCSVTVATGQSAYKVIALGGDF